MAKTIVVEVTHSMRHPIYSGIITQKKKFYAHDEEAAAKVSDVRASSSTPLSRLKRAVRVRWGAQGQVGAEPAALGSGNGGGE